MILSQEKGLSPLKVNPPSLDEPEEFDPIELQKLAKKEFHWKVWEFAIKFGCEPATIYAWRCGKNVPGRQARIIAGLLKNQWQI